MKKLLVLLFSLLISFNSYGEWTFYAENEDGTEYFVDEDTIKLRNGYVYWWRLTNHIKPTIYGDMSAKVYSQGDCAQFRYKHLTGIFYDQEMGKGNHTATENPTNPQWSYPPPESVNEGLLKNACDYVD